MRHLKQIFDKLQLSKENGLFTMVEDNWKGVFSSRVERLLEKVIKPDAIFSIDNKPFILFFDSPENKKKKLKKIWNFNESPIVIITEGDSLEIYNGFEYITEKDSLRLLGSTEKLNDFSYFELVTGKTWENYQKDFSYNHRVDYKLLKNIKAARDLLIADGLSIELTNSLLGKVIFVRYLIDREVKLDFEKEGTSRKWINTEFCGLLSNKQNVKAFFKYLKKKFNGDLFPISDDDIDSISASSLSIIVKLLSGDEVDSGQISLFNLYDFSIIPVEFISNVYELFIGQDQRENQGAYYTPLFLVDYILSETVEKKFRSQPASYDCKVLDPSCGSGIFLVETLRKIIEQYQKNNPDYLKDIEEYKKQLKQLALDNIFGIDKDQSAVNVAIFSIYLTLLDYQNPSNIETFKFPILYKKNFFSDDFFDQDADFNKRLRSIEFDYILGNPPWKGNGIGESGKKYLKNRLANEKKKSKRYPIGINNGEIAEGFVLRVSDFTSVDTINALIVRSTILYNKGYSENSKFRQYFLEEFYVKKVLELAPVRFEVFDKSNDPAIAPAAVLFYKYANGLNTDDNVIEHLSLKPSKFFSLFKVFSISRNDYKKVNQQKLKQFDWLWKTLVYGSYLDFNLINRLKEEYTSLKNVLSDTTKFKKGTGITLSKNGVEDSSHLIGKPFLDSERVKSFFIDTNRISEFTIQKVGRRRDVELFSGPVLLVRNGLDTQLFKPRAAIFNSPVVYKKALTGIRTISSKDANLLANIVGNLHSDLYPYLAINTFCSIGIEREQTKDYEKFDVPHFSKGLDTYVNKIVKAKKSLFEELNKPLTDDFKINQFKDEISTNLSKISQKIYDGLNIKKDSVEYALIDYALNIVRPLMTRDKSEVIHNYLFKPLKANDRYLDKYISLFLNKFNHIYNKSDQKLIVQVRRSDQIIGLFFHLIQSSENADTVEYIEADNSDILQMISVLGNERITDRLFIQKDIRGFEKDGFYIVKPNEKRLWHKAIAHLDLNEFTDAMLTAGKQHAFNVR